MWNLDELINDTTDFIYSSLGKLMTRNVLVNEKHVVAKNKIHIAL